MCVSSSVWCAGADEGSYWGLLQLRGENESLSSIGVYEWPIEARFFCCVLALKDEVRVQLKAWFEMPSDYGTLV